MAAIRHEKHTTNTPVARARLPKIYEDPYSSTDLKQAITEFDASRRLSNERAHTSGSRHETSAWTKIKVLAGIGAVAASPFIATKIAHGLGNEEHAPWQHGNQPAHTHQK